MIAQQTTKAMKPDAGKTPAMSNAIPMTAMDKSTVE